MANEKRVRVNIYHDDHKTWTINIKASNNNEAIVEAYKHFVYDGHSVRSVSYVETTKVSMYE